MLQRWRKPITIALTPESISINSGEKAIQVIELQKYANNDSWNQALIALEKDAINIRPGRLKFILSNHYVRYAILPWQSDIYSKQDWQSLAENHLRSLYGSVVESWKISVAMQGYGKPIIISAIDLLLLERLEVLAKEFDWIVMSVEPALMTVFNHYRNSVKANGFLMMIEPERVLLAEWVKNHFVSFTISCPTSGEELAESSKLIKRNIRLKSSALPVNINVFSNNENRLNSEAGKIIINPLNSNHAVMSSMMAELI